MQLIGRDTGRVRLAAETHYPGDVRSVHSHLLETYLLKSMDSMAEVPYENLGILRDNATGMLHIDDKLSACAADEYGRGRERCFFRRPYHKIISCPGWRFDQGPFDAALRPALVRGAALGCCHSFCGLVKEGELPAA